WGQDYYHQNEVPPTLGGVIAIADGVDHSLAIVRAGLTLDNPRWRNGVFTVSVQTQAGKTYTLQYKVALPDTAWICLPAVMGNGSTLTLSDPTASSSQRLYRANGQ